MSLKRFLTAAFWLISSVSAHAALRPCAGENMPEVRVQARLVQPVVDHNTPRSELTTVATMSRPGEADGLTDFQVNAQLNLQRDGRRGQCLLGAVHVELSPAQTLVYIAREVEVSSCRYRAVYDHELKHVMLAQKAMDRQVSLLRKALRDALADVLEHEAEAHMLSAMKERLDRVVARGLEALHRDYAAGNATLDTDEESWRLHRMCSEPETFIGARGVTITHAH